MSKKNRNDKYNYKQYTMILDLDVIEEKEISDFLKQNKGKRNNFNDQIKKAMKQYIKSSVAEEGSNDT